MEQIAKADGISSSRLVPGLPHKVDVVRAAGARKVDELASAAESAGQEAAPIVDRLFGTRAAKRAPRWKCGNKRPNSSIV
jgi:hypothetical protein